jgi:hypothetical protein
MLLNEIQKASRRDLFITVGDLSPVRANLLDLKTFNISLSANNLKYRQPLVIFNHFIKMVHLETKRVTEGDVFVTLRQLLRITHTVINLVNIPSDP